MGSGSLLNNKWLLTSAHIIGASQKTNPTSIVLVFGMIQYISIEGNMKNLTHFHHLGIVDELSGADSVPSHAQFYRAGSTVIHPKFHKKTYDYDLALV